MAHVFPPFVEIADTPHGVMIFPKEDLYVGRSFKEYGEFSAGELEIFRQVVQPGAMVLDIGANIGAHTVPLAQMVGPEGAVIAFEPQRILYQILCGNLALNGVTNVVAHAMALSDVQGSCKIPVLDYGQNLNFGCLAIDTVSEGETVPVGTLDLFELARVDFIKLDVEGFERQVLLGGERTLKRCRPILYLENDRREKSPDLIQVLLDMGYRLWWHTPPLFSPNNFKGNPENVFPGLASSNMLAIPREQDYEMGGFREAKDPSDWFC